MDDSNHLFPRDTVRIAIAVDETGATVKGHAGQCRHWLTFTCRPGENDPAGQVITLAKEQLPHHFQDDGPHPLHGTDVLVAASAGDGFIRHMAKWNARVLLTGEREPRAALQKILAGEALPDTRFDVTTTLCKLRDRFARH